MTKTMKWLAATLWIVGFSLFGYAAHAERLGYYITGNQLLEACESTKDYPKASCINYITGLADGLISTGDYCIPVTVTNIQIRDIVITDLIIAPKIRHLPASNLVAASLGMAYPCKSDKPKITS